jgi:integrase
MARGRVYRRGSTWSWRIDDPNAREQGVRRQPSRGGFRTKKAAEDALSDALAAMRAGAWADPSTLTVEKHLERWLHGARPELKDTTLAGYRNAVNRIVPHLGRIKVQSLTATHVRNLMTDLHDQGLAPKTIANTHAVLRAALGRAIEDGVIGRNPMASIKAPPVPKREHTVWTPGQIREFLESLGDSRFHAPVLVAAVTGLRRAEVLGLRWRDLDLDVGVLTIAQTLTAVRGRPVFTSPKTKTSRRTIPIDAGTVAALRAHRAAQAAERLAAGEVWDDSHDLVFRDELGRLINPDRFTRAFTSAVEASGLPKIRLHDLRHSWATNAFVAGAAAKTVSEQLGHSGISITLDTYTSVPAQTARDAVDVVASQIHGG